MATIEDYELEALEQEVAELRDVVADVRRAVGGRPNLNPIHAMRRNLIRLLPGRDVEVLEIAAEGVCFRVLIWDSPERNDLMVMEDSNNLNYVTDKALGKYRAMMAPTKDSIQTGDKQ